MIWYFLAGLIGGATGMVWFARWWMERHSVTVTKEEMDELIKKVEDNNDE
jgi:hypothetical protein